MKREYRVAWRRDGTTRRHRIFATLVAAERLGDNLAERDHLHWKCDEAHDDCMEPIVEGPIIEERLVDAWHTRAGS